MPEPRLPRLLSVAKYLASLPADRRRELARVRQVVRKHLPPGYREAVAAGMIVYEVPLRHYADTYNKKPLWYAALAAPKGHLTLHLMPVYGDAGLLERLRRGFTAAGKKLDIGKACIRFRNADDLALEAIADIVASVPLERYVAVAKAARRPRKRGARR